MRRKLPQVGIRSLIALQVFLAVFLAYGFRNGRYTSIAYRLSQQGEYAILATDKFTLAIAGASIEGIYEEGTLQISGPGTSSCIGSYGDLSLSSSYQNGILEITVNGTMLRFSQACQVVATKENRYVLQNKPVIVVDGNTVRLVRQADFPNREQIRRRMRLR